MPRPRDPSRTRRRVDWTAYSTPLSPPASRRWRLARGRAHGTSRQPSVEWLRRPARRLPPAYRRAAASDAGAGSSPAFNSSTSLSVRWMRRVPFWASSILWLASCSFFWTRRQRVAELREVGLHAAEQFPHLARVPLDGQRAESHLQARDERPQRRRSGHDDAELPLQALDERRAAEHLGVQPLGRQEEDGEIGGARRVDVLVADVAGRVPHPCLQGLGRQFAAAWSPASSASTSRW